MNKEPNQTSDSHRRVSPITPDGQKHFKLISCEIIFREAALLAAQSPHIIDMEFLRKGLHDAGQETMSRSIQEVINNVPVDDYDAILLGYGRCNNGVRGLKCSGIPLVIPRAHDCITLFFGSQKAYEAYFSEKPGTYYRTSGWTERSDAGDDSVMHQLGLDRSYDEYVAKYGKENADYIIQSLGSWETNYNYLTYIDMGMAVDAEYARLAETEAARRDLHFERISGDLRLLRNLLFGEWDEREFLVVRPGQMIESDDDGQVIRAVTA